ncbi:MAG: DUF2997 domain-containing protein [Desulfurococcaceae archaeon]|nr:DUF2997 domain-containing protein [Desulfurococcaceae archaeon]
MPTTRIVVTKDGRVYIEGINYVGEQCLKDLEKILSALKSVGINVSIESIQLKPEARAVQAQRAASHG